MGVRLGQAQQRMDTWMRLTPVRLESRFTKQMSQLSPPSPSFRHHSSPPGLPHGRFGSLYRFNGSSGIQTRKGIPRRKTDGQTETERQRTRSERNRGKKREKTDEGALFYRHENYEG